MLQIWWQNFSGASEVQRGFTLIELLIVIAIIGVLAATVVVSLGSQTDKAQISSVKSGVSSLRTVATITVVGGGYGANGICDDIYPQVSGEKSNWTWGKQGTDDTQICKADSVAGSAGEICCSSTNEKWVLWAKLSGNGKGTGEVYCADSGGFLGKFTLANSSTDTKINTTVKKGQGVVGDGNSAATIESCE